MKEYSIDNTLSRIRELPESVGYEELARMVVAVPVAAAAGIGLSKLIIKFLNAKFLIPMFFTTTSASLAVWYAVQTFSPAPQTNEKEMGQNPEPVVIQMNKDLPMTMATIQADSQRKKMVKKQEIRVVKKGSNGDKTELAPLPPLPPLPPGKKGEKMVQKEERVVIQDMEDEKGDKNDPMADPFISALVDYLVKEGLVKSKENFTVKLTPGELEVNSAPVSKEHLNRVIQIFEEKEGEKFGKGSVIDIKIKKNERSVSKTIEN
jgi:hypothetical protein